MSAAKDIRIGGKSYEPIKDTAKRYDKDKEKPVVTTGLVDKQRRKLDNLMARIDKPLNIPDRPKEWKPSDPKEFVRNVMGSSAGAGSGEFHVYRAIRKRTMQREEFLTKKKEESDVQKEFNKRVAENREKEEAKTAKKRLKRQKRKANKKKPKQEVVESSEDSEDQVDDAAPQTNEDNSQCDGAREGNEPVDSSLLNKQDEGQKSEEIEASGKGIENS